MPSLPQVEDPEEAAFQSLYGPWAPLDPAGVAELLAGFGRPWWIAGGWAIEAATGVARRHEDIDVAIFRRDVGVLRTYLQPAYHCWAAGSGTLRPLTDEQPELPEWSEQAWIREHARAPWLADFVASEDADGDWVFRRDPTFTAPLGDVTWTDAATGIRYLNPEIALAYKAKQQRPKDNADLSAALPILDQPARRWLEATVGRLHPDHVWLEQLR